MKFLRLEPPELLNVREKIKEEKRQKEGSPRVWKSVLNFESQPLFIEAEMFEKLAKWSKYELGRVLISKKWERMCFSLIQVPSGRGPNLCQSALQNCRMALLGDSLVFEFWSVLESFFEVFLVGTCT